MDNELTKTEQRAVEHHQEELSDRRGYEVPFEEAKEDWLAHYAASWREERQRRMLELQREEINRYKWIQSEKANRDLGRDAVMDWVKNHAAEWREWYEEEYEPRYSSY